MTGQLHFVMIWGPSETESYPTDSSTQASLSITNSWSWLKLMCIKSVMPSYHLILCHPLFLLPSIFPSIRVFSNESVLRIRWPKDWSFSFSISPSNEHSGLISFRMDWLDLLADQESSPTPQFQSINFSALSLLYGPTFTSIHDDWKNPSFDHMDLCQQNDVSRFLTIIQMRTEKTHEWGRDAEGEIIKATSIHRHRQPQGGEWEPRMELPSRREGTAERCYRRRKGNWTQRWWG